MEIITQAICEVCFEHLDKNACVDLRICSNCCPDNCELCKWRRKCMRNLDPR